MSETYTTAQVADLIGVELKTLQKWVREGYLSPESEGKGRQKRHTWAPEHVAAAREYATDKVQAKKARDVRDTLLDLLGADGLRNLNRALDMQCPQGSVLAAGPDGARAVRLNEPVSRLLGRIGGRGIILPPQV